ncbi:AfsR/SARP family transcriptional regulator [Amycolatopsis sp. NPDC003676]
MEYRILGPVGIGDGNREIPVDGVKLRTVLAALLLSGGRVTSDGQMSDLLWGQRPPATSSAQIWTYISRLRKLLGQGATIVRRTPGYLLDIGQEGAFDYAEFEADVERGRTAAAAGSHDEASACLRAALMRWRGPALSNVSEHLFTAEAGRLEEAKATAAEDLMDADLMLGRYAQILPELTRLVRQYPLRERFRAQSMVVLYRLDRQAEALALFDEGRRKLAEELGIDPGGLLRGVHQAILAGAGELPWPARDHRQIRWSSSAAILS